MSSFDAGSITGKLGLDYSDFADSMREAQSIGGEFAEAFNELLTDISGNPALGQIAANISRSLMDAFSGDWEEAALSSFRAVAEGAEQMFDVVKEQAESMHEAGLAAEKAGVSVDFITAIGNAGKNAGAGIEQLSFAMKFLEQRAAEARDGNKETIKMFSDVGISVEQLKGNLKDPEQLFYALADGIKSVQDPSDRTKDAMALMSRAGEDMIPFLSQGSEVIRQQAEEMKKLGGTYDDEDARIGRSVGTLKNEWDAAMTGMEAAASRPILDYLDQHSKELTADIEDLAKFMETNLPGAMEKVMKVAGELAHAIGDIATAIKSVYDAFVELDAWTDAHLNIGGGPGGWMDRLDKWTDQHMNIPEGLSKLDKWTDEHLDRPKFWHGAINPENWPGMGGGDLPTLPLPAGSAPAAAASGSPTPADSDFSDRLAAAISNAWRDDPRIRTPEIDADITGLISHNIDASDLLSGITKSSDPSMQALSQDVRDFISRFAAPIGQSGVAPTTQPIGQPEPTTLPSGGQLPASGGFRDMPSVTIENINVDPHQIAQHVGAAVEAHLKVAHHRLAAEAARATSDKLRGNL